VAAVDPKEIGPGLLLPNDVPVDEPEPNANEEFVAMGADTPVVVVVGVGPNANVDVGVAELELGAPKENVDDCVDGAAFVEP
ncbi:unnamed protein product, partial [Rotaria magnacalcarata]